MKLTPCLLFLPAILTCCGEDELTPPRTEAEVEVKQIVLGDKLPNPYSLSVMQRAADELAESSSLKSAQLLQATHRYIRFAPRDTAEIDLLEADTAIFFYSYPMDYEIAQEGDTYTDPNKPDSVVKYMYCAVEVDHKLPDVPYEILDELYILESTNVIEDSDTDEANAEQGNKSVADDEYWEALEAKAQEIVGAEAQTNKSRWRPQGDVRYHDTSTGKDIPLEGVPVRCRKSIFVTHQCCTDKNGHFEFGRLRGRVTYYIRWRRDHFKIREHTGLNVAETNLKTHTKSSVSYTVTPGTLAWECASIFRAAHFYYYKAKDYGLSSPSKNSLTIRPSAKYNPTKNGCYNNHVFGSDIHIYCIGGTSADIFCTTTHEIAHSVHHFWDVIKYYKYDSKTKETWAEGMAWYLTGRVYNIAYYSAHLHYNNKTYTSLVRYLFEDCNFSLAEIESGFKRKSKWEELKSYFKNLKPERHADIDNAFARCE